MYDSKRREENIVGKKKAVVLKQGITVMYANVDGVMPKKF